jgi:hypothetical protein
MQVAADQDAMYLANGSDNLRGLLLYGTVRTAEYGTARYVQISSQPVGLSNHHQDKDTFLALSRANTLPRACPPHRFGHETHASTPANHKPAVPECTVTPNRIWPSRLAGEFSRTNLGKPGRVVPNGMWRSSRDRVASLPSFTAFPRFTFPLRHLAVWCS